MEVDPSALFSVLFVDGDTFTDYSPGELIDLDYSFLGSGPMIKTSGVWTDVQMVIPKLYGVTDEANYVTVDVTIFVAIGNPADTGLDGTLSVCVVPSTPNWSKVSIFPQLDNLPRIYVSWMFTENAGLFSGTLVFADTSLREDSMTLGGQVIVQEQITTNDEDLFNQSVVNPFLELNLAQI